VLIHSCYAEQESAPPHRQNGAPPHFFKKGKKKSFSLNQHLIVT